MMKSFFWGAGALLLCALPRTGHAQEQFSPFAPLVTSNQRRGAGDFQLATTKKAAPIYLDANDFPVVQIAAEALADDIERVTTAKPSVQSTAPAESETAVFLGTVGKSRLIDGLVAAKKLDVDPIRGQWERYVIATVENPLPGVRQALVIAGSDRRGTAYGAFSVSESIGVSPWVWWADVAPAQRDSIVIRKITFTSQPPVVKYRGIFINDEDWGIKPWASQTLEPETNNIGPKTYARVGELLLRLRANYLWPAMHEVTAAFNSIPANKVVMDNYAIVMGSSHAEPMLFNNASEWKLPKASWNYVTNASDIKAVWEKRLQENGHYENSYTLGIRGIHDSRMAGGGTVEEGARRLEGVIADQRALLARYVNSDVSKVPQFFVPYKEVMTYYQAGMQVPDDATLVWVDDNHGYIRQLSSPQEQKRSGGSGVYYHDSYWGQPADYLWLGTTSLALTWEEMHKAYENNAQRVWVLNVGDIKPMEIGMEFFLRMAWKPNAFGENAQQAFLTQWAGRDFGPEHTAEIAAIMDEYYRLNYVVKPEHLDKVKFSSNSESTERLSRFARLVEKTDALYAEMPAAKRDGFYEMVVYPVRCSALMNQKWLTDDRATADKAFDQIQEETAYYNDKIAGGKWKNILSANPRKQAVFGRRVVFDTPPAPAAAATDNLPAPTDSIAFEAENPTRKITAEGTFWTVIAGLGRTGDSITLLPTTFIATRINGLEYDFTTTSAGPAKVQVTCIPTHSLRSGLQLRYSASVDKEPAQVVDLETQEFSPQWSWNVINAAAIGKTSHTLTAGKHTLTLRPLDPGVVFDKVVVDRGDVKPSMLGLPATNAH